MQHFAKTMLCTGVLGLLAAAPVSANLVGPGNYSGGYIGSVHTLVYNVPGISVNYSIHPTHSGCTTGLNNIVNTFMTYPSITIVQVIPCHYVAGTGPIDEVDPDPMSPERILGALQGEEALRDRYNVEAYERDLQALWQIQADGGN